MISQAVHMHRLGKRARTSRRRQDPKSLMWVELPPLAEVAFDYHFQSMLPVPAADTVRGWKYSNPHPHPHPDPIP